MPPDFDSPLMPHGGYESLRSYPKCKGTKDIAP